MIIFFTDHNSRLHIELFRLFLPRLRGRKKKRMKGKY